MGLYSNYTYNSTTDHLSDVKLMSFPESSSILESGFESVVECEHSWNGIMQSIALDELAVLESTGEEVVYESVSIKGIFEAIGNFFKKIWAAIAGLIAKFLNWLDVEGKKNAAFVKKYADKIKKVKVPGSADISLENYDFAGLKAGVDYDKLFNGYEKYADEKAGWELLKKTTNGKDPSLYYQDFKQYIDKTNEAHEQCMNMVRGTLIPGGDLEITSKDFPKKFKEYMMGKKEDKLAVNSIDKDELIDYVKDAKKAKADVKEAYNKLKKKINDCISNVKRMEAELLKDAKEQEKDMSKEAKKSSDLKMSIASILTSELKETSTIAQKANTIHLTTISSKVKQCKKITVYLVKNYVDKKSSNESATYQFESAFGLNLL